MKLSIVHKIGLLSALLVTLTTGVVITVFYTNISAQLVEQSLTDLVEKVNNQGRWIQTHIEAQRKDVLVLSNTPPIQGILRARNAGGHDVKEGSDLNQWKNRFAKIFQALVKVNPDYLQVRLIDTKGQELMSIINSDSGVIIVADSELQKKAHRKFVRETLKLPLGETYISEINLNRKSGEVIKPHQEVLRTATPIFDQDRDELGGIVVLNSEIGHQLRRMQVEIQASGREIYITNDYGGYLLHPDASKVYGFDLGHHYRAQEDTPQLAKLFLPDNMNKQLVMLPEETHSLTATVFTKIPFDVAKPERYIAVGITESYDAIIKSQTAVLRNTLVWAVFVGCLGVLLALLFSMRLIQPLKIIAEAIDDFAHQRETKVKLPIDQNDEIGLLARTFEFMFGQVQHSQNELRNLNKELESRIEERTHSLKNSEALQRTIVETMADALIMIDNNGIVQSINKAAETIFGYTPEEIVNRNINMLMTDSNRLLHDSYLSNYGKTGIASIIGIGRELEGLRKDGDVFPMDLSVSEMKLDEEVLYTGIIRDITERKRMEKIKNEFISTVSHELRTPLTSIRGSLGLVNGGAVGELPERAKNMLAIAGNNTERLLLLINDILDVQKIESGEIMFKFASVDIMSLLETAISNNFAYGYQHDVKFEVTKKIDGVRIFADADRIIQVLNNLLSNAAKFSPQGDTVEINVSRHHDDILRISVTDHGAGIPEDFQPSLFEKFTQSDSSDTRQKGGTGLGLSISKEIMKKHGGHIGFVTGKNIGTTMYFEIPEIIGSDDINEVVSPQKIENSHLSTILIIEDDREVATLLQHMMAGAGFNSDIAHNAVLARQLLKEKSTIYKLLTLDINLPGEDGIQLLKSLRNDENAIDIPIVVVSVKSDEARRELNGGAVKVVDWLQKPIDQDRLLHVVKQVVGKNKKTKILHIEDEPDVHKVVSILLEGGCEMSWSQTLSASRKMLEDESFDLVLLDIALPDGSGLDLLEVIARRCSPPRVVIFSASDVSERYANQVAAVLVKSNTSNERLAEVIESVVVA